MIRKIAAFGLPFALACASEPAANTYDLADAIAAEQGIDDSSADAVRRTKVVGNIELDSTIQGTFSERVRVYGYSFAAHHGATLTAALQTFAGASTSLGTLDTRMAVYGPAVSETDFGPLVVESEDGATGEAPPAIVRIEHDGVYMVVFSSWDPTGSDSQYKLSLACEGTDYQCRRAEWNRPCEPGRTYIQGGQISEDTEWNRCEVIVLEPTTIHAGKTLTIRPGVHVKMNFIGTGDYGTVGLDVRGTLQAVGTSENPVRFVPFVDGKGWAGISLRGLGNRMEHAYIGSAMRGITAFAQSETTLANVTIEARPGGTNNAIGLVSEGNNTLHSRHLVIKGHNTGVSSSSDHLEIVDSVIRDNVFGIRVVAGAADRACGTTDPSPRPTVFDPIIRRSDIINNDIGIQVEGDGALLVVEHSNVIDNSTALQIFGRSLAANSYLRNNNFISKGAREVISSHYVGGLDITWNYWVDISDPQLSANWQGCASNRSRFLMTGFSPEMLTAGPDVMGADSSLRDAIWHH